MTDKSLIISVSEILKKNLKILILMKVECYYKKELFYKKRKNY